MGVIGLLSSVQTNTDAGHRLSHQHPVPASSRKFAECPRAANEMIELGRVPAAADEWLELCPVRPTGAPSGLQVSARRARITDRDAAPGVVLADRIKRRREELRAVVVGNQEGQVSIDPVGLRAAIDRRIRLGRSQREEGANRRAQEPRRNLPGGGLSARVRLSRIVLAHRVAAPSKRSSSALPALSRSHRTLLDDQDTVMKVHRVRVASVVRADECPGAVTTAVAMRKPL